MDTLTFLFTDIEGSTALLRRLGEGDYGRVLADHRALIRAALAAHDAGPAGPALPPAHRGQPHRPGPAADAAGHGRLVVLATQPG